MNAFNDQAKPGGEEDVRQEFLTFTLVPEEYAIGILAVQEIRSYERPTTIANRPPFIKGVINLRGTIVPIIDMRIKFDVGQVEYTPITMVIILNICRRVVGIVVDSVSDVTPMTSSQVRSAPEFATTVDTKYILGLATIGERMLIVADVGRLMQSSDMCLMDEATVA